MRALILAPTRELALQVYESVRSYSKHTPIRAMCAFGGVDIKPQIAELKKGVEILVATPGRLLDHVENKSVSFNSVQALVLDEADRMLDMGFIDDVAEIGKSLPKSRQTLLFSATFEGAITKLAATILRDPQRRNTTLERTEAPIEPEEAQRLLSIANPTELLRAGSHLMSFTMKVGAPDPIPFGPVVDGSYLPRSPLDAARVGDGLAHPRQDELDAAFPTPSVRTSHFGA